MSTTADFIPRVFVAQCPACGNRWRNNMLIAPGCMEQFERYLTRRQTPCLHCGGALDWLEEENPYALLESEQGE